MNIIDFLANLLSKPQTHTYIALALFSLWQGVILYKFNKKLEKEKADFAKQLEKEKADIKKSTMRSKETKDLYRKAFELIYRNRNSAQDIIKHDFDDEKIKEFLRYQNKLIEFMYEERYDLELLDCFKPLHSFKNLLITFSETLPKTSTESISAEVEKDIAIEYKNLEEKYEIICDIIKSSKDEI